MHQSHTPLHGTVALNLQLLPQTKWLSRAILYENVSYITSLFIVSELVI